MTYSLHRKLGEDFEAGGVRYRIVAALDDSLFQSELIVSEQNFLRLFSDSEGYSFFLLSVPAGREEAVTRTLEDSLSDYGFEVQPAAARLAAFHRVENTYLSTFRALGGLGLVLGTVGLAAVLLRSVLERRRELALLRAVGYRARDLAVMVPGGECEPAADRARHRRRMRGGRRGPGRVPPRRPLAHGIPRGAA